MVNIEKKDWESAKKQFEALLINAKVNIECYEATLKMIEQKLNEFPDEEKIIKEELKADFNQLVS